MAVHYTLTLVFNQPTGRPDWPRLAQVDISAIEVLPSGECVTPALEPLVDRSALAPASGQSLWSYWEYRMFTDKVFVVTGAAGNVGSALATLLASRGARVAAVDTVRDRLQAVTASLSGAGHLALSDFDLTDAAATTALVAEVRRTCGRLDGVGTTVGGFAMAGLADAGPEQWDAMFSLNVKTTWNIYRAAVPVMREVGGGALVAIGAAAGLKGAAGMAAYGAMKSAVLRLTESLADELRADRIRVNAVLPGTIDTPQNRAAMPGADMSRWVKPAEVAEAIAFLLSHRASGITGALLPVG
jgi:NAD(P)-dependent dehydrogenase (short-subunit alcohol dehydrogenase family)